ncbi:MAG: FHA domain-containing protein [Deltaproteobacteria bacterium]|nr:FHA domain-containing protein [Deltaproteobacteria bacterium]
MSIIRRLLSPSYRRALVAEAGGQLEEAARQYALAGQRDKVADMHLRLAERASDPVARIASLRNALDWLDTEADIRVVEVALAGAILGRAKIDGVAGARDVEMLEESAALFEDAEEWGRAAEAHELLGRREDVARCYERGGLVEKLESLLDQEQATESGARTARLAFQDYEMELAAGGRDRALASLRRAAATAKAAEGYDELLRKFELRFPPPGRILLKVGSLEYRVIGRLPAILGRAEAEVSLRHAGISRRHARISRAGGRFLIEDAGSRNGTTLEGIAVGGALPLLGSGTIGLGDACKLRFEERGATLSLEVVEGLDRGRRFVLADGRFEIPDASPTLSFDASGRARLISSAPVSLNGKRTVEPIVLIAGDLVEAGATRIEVPDCQSGNG